MTLAFSKGPNSESTSLYIRYTRLRWTTRLRAGRRTWSPDTSILSTILIQYDHMTQNLGHKAYSLYHSFCGIVTRCYDPYFGSCDHIVLRWCLRCSYEVIICGGLLGDAPSIGVLCSVYKARCCRTSGLWKKQVSLMLNRK